MNAITRCPFCGAPGQLHVMPDGDNIVRCSSIACKIHPCTKAGVKSDAEAIDLWNHRLSDHHEVQTELRIELSRSVILARLTPEEYKALEDARLPYSGSTGADAKPESYNDMAPYIATFLRELPKAMEIMGWTGVANPKALASAVEAKERAERARKGTQQWYARHYGKLQDWARTRLPGQWANEFFCCIANGTWGLADIGKPYESVGCGTVTPTNYFRVDTAHGQLILDQTQRAEEAERERDAARAEADQLRAKLDALLAVWNKLTAEPHPWWLEHIPSVLFEAIESLANQELRSIGMEYKRRFDDLDSLTTKAGHCVTYGKEGRVALDGRTIEEVVEAEKHPTLDKLGPVL